MAWGVRGVTPKYQSSYTSTSVAYPSGISYGDVGVLALVIDHSSNTVNDPSGWDFGGRVEVTSTMSIFWWTRAMSGSESGNVALSWSKTTKAAAALWVGYGMLLTGSGNSSAIGTGSSLSCATVSAALTDHVWLTVYGERSSSPSTAFTSPASTDNNAAVYGTGSGATSIAAATGTSLDSDGTVGGGSWSRDGSSGATGTISWALPIAATTVSPAGVSADAGVPVDGWATRNALVVIGGESKQGSWV